VGARQSAEARNVGPVSTLEDPRVTATLDRTYAESNAQMAELRTNAGRFAQLESATAQERADALSDIYMPVTRESGRLIYSLVRASRPQTIVEFGMSLGLSAIHLAAAVRDNGVGRIYTTELSTAKIEGAKRNFTDTGLDDLIEVLAGDALETLKSVDGPIGFVLLDGWKELYVPVLEIIEPRLSPGAIVLADNTSMDGTKPYLEYVRDPANGYVSVNFPVRDSDSMELSCRV